MVTLFDTNTLIYASDPVSPFHAWAKETLLGALTGDGAAVNAVILAELAVGDRDPESVPQRLERLGILFLDLPCAASPRAAEGFRSCLEARRESGLETGRKMPLPDFFIGAHAEILRLPIATVDTARYRIYFPKVVLVTPGEQVSSAS